MKQLEEQMTGIESPTPGQLYKLDRYKSLLRQVRNEMGGLGREMAGAMKPLLFEAGELGVESATELALTRNASATVTGAFDQLDPKGIARAVSFAQDDGPLFTMLEGEYGEGWANVISDSYVRGVALGWSPRRTVKAIEDVVDVAGPADIDRIVRTAQIWSYRETNSAAWQESGVVDSWVWSSALDDRTCGSCWAMHGTVHEVSETLNDHHRGRCAAVPSVDGEAPNIESGEAMFGNLSEGEQERIAADGGWGAQYRAWQDGAIDFEDMAGSHDDSIYGEMRTQRSLSGILGDDAEGYYAGAEADE